MLVSPPPPMRAGSPVRAVTPGASDASAVKLRLAIGRFSTALVGIGERSLAALRLHERRFGLDDDGIGQAADFDRERADRQAVAGADADARCVSMVLKPVMLT